MSGREIQTIMPKLLRGSLFSNAISGSVTIAVDAVVVADFRNTVYPAEVIVRLYIIDGLRGEACCFALAAAHVVTNAAGIAITLEILGEEVAIAVIPEGVAGIF